MRLAKKTAEVQRDERQTDLGNAKRLVALYGRDIRYVPEWERWLVWESNRWRIDPSKDAVLPLAKTTIRFLYTFASAIKDDQRQSLLIDHARKSERLERLRAMATLAQTEPGIPVSPDALDADPWLLNCLNGTVDLRTGELRPHRRGDLITKRCPVCYSREARSDLWERFLRRVTGGDEALAAFLQRAIGYALTGHTWEEIVLFLIGPAASGKTTFIEAIKAALGDYAVTAEFETFLVKDGRGPRSDIARLAGARLVSASEGPPGRQLDERLVKQGTGGDRVTARHLYKEEFEFTPQFLLILGANHRPTIRGDDDAIWRRVLEVPFAAEIPPEERDPQVKATLRDPAQSGAAILAWAVEGCLAWQRERLQVPEAVKRATAAYRSEMSVFDQFLEERCQVGPVFWVASQRFNQAFQGWAVEQGYRYPLGPQRIAAALRNRGFVPRKKGDVRGWEGLQLAPVDGADGLDTVSGKSPYGNR